MSCGVRARGALFYKVSAGSYFLSGVVKKRHFLRKWCSKWCSKIAVRDVGRDGNKFTRKVDVFFGLAIHSVDKSRNYKIEDST